MLDSFMNVNTQKKSIKLRNECNEGIVMQTHVYENDVNILMVVYHLSLTWLPTKSHSKLIQKIVQTTCICLKE